MRNVFIVIGFFIACQLYAQSDSASVYVAQYKGDKAGAVSYTFDDGYAEHYTWPPPNWRNAVSAALSSSTVQ